MDETKKPVNNPAGAESELNAGLGVTPSSGETAKERKERLRKAREIAAELEQEERDERFAEKRAMASVSRSTRRDDIFLKYAQIVLERVLSEPSIKPLDFATGGAEHTIALLKKVTFAVTNMATELTNEHIKRNP